MTSSGTAAPVGDTFCGACALSRVCCTGAAAAPDVSAEGGRGSGDARAARAGPEAERTLATVLNDILHERITYKGPEEKVQILGVLGRGMQGKVMLGKWKGVDVAYKVVQLPMAMSQQDSAHTRAMLEMAISATMAHPNVVQTYSYEMVYVEAESPFATPPATAEALTEGGAGGEADVNVDSILEASVSLAEQDEPLAIQAAGHHEARLIQVRWRAQPPATTASGFVPRPRPVNLREHPSLSCSPSRHHETQSNNQVDKGRVIYIAQQHSAMLDI